MTSVGTKKSTPYIVPSFNMSYHSSLSRKVALSVPRPVPVLELGGVWTEDSVGA